jgi:hypothetical protein
MAAISGPIRDFSRPECVYGAIVWTDVDQTEVQLARRVSCSSISPPSECNGKISD